MGPMANPPGSWAPPSAAAPRAAPTDRFTRGQEAILARLQPLLGRVLEPGETVRVATRACTPFSVLEFLTTGWIVTILKRCALVFTDRRIIHIPTTPSFAARESVSQIRYADIASISFSGVLGRAVKIVDRNGTKETFSAIGRSELKEIREVIPPLVGSGSMTAFGGRHHLCPRCRSALVADRFDCPGCGLEFKSRAKARRLSLLLPGGGYFYTRHPLLGSLDALIEVYLVVLVLVGLVLGVTGTTSDDVAVGWMLVIFFGFVLAIEKAITIYHANHFVKEYLPVEMRIAAAPQG